MPVVNNVLQVQIYTHNRKEEHERLIGLIKEDEGCVLVYAKPNEYWRPGDHPEYTWIIEAYYDRTKLSRKQYLKLKRNHAPTKLFKGVFK